MEADRKTLVLGDEYGPNRGRRVDIHEGVNRFNLQTVGSIWRYGDRPYCTGVDWMDANGKTHPSAVVTAYYIVRYIKRETYIIGTHVPMSQYDDSSCHLLPPDTKTHCYNKFSGTNYFVRKAPISKHCSLLPTRPETVKGQILTDQRSRKVFLSHEDKILLKLTKVEDLCDCSRTWETGYKGLYLREVDGCRQLPSTDLPPASLNMESQTNIKLGLYIINSKYVDS